MLLLALGCRFPQVVINVLTKIEVGSRIDEYAVELPHF